MSTPPSLYRLLATYWDRYAALDVAMQLADDTDPDTSSRKKADTAQAKAGDLVTAALVDICSYLPTWKVEARIKQEFLASHVRWSGSYLEPDATAALFETVGQLTLPKPEGGVA